MIANEDPRMTSYVTTVRKLSAEEKVAQACEARRRYSNDIASYEEEKRLAKQEAEEAKQEVEEARQMLAEKDRLIEEMARELELLRGKVK